MSLSQAALLLRYLTTYHLMLACGIRLIRVGSQAKQSASFVYHVSDLDYFPPSRCLFYFRQPVEGGGSRWRIARGHRNCNLSCSFFFSAGQPARAGSLLSLPAYSYRARYHCRAREKTVVQSMMTQRVRKRKHKKKEKRSHRFFRGRPGLILYATFRVVFGAGLMSDTAAVSRYLSFRVHVAMCSFGSPGIAFHVHGPRLPTISPHLASPRLASSHLAASASLASSFCRPETSKTEVIRYIR
ncbi:hypothetical protein F4780DRAFT_733417 [Xylariomycetidae sp. FL0641]|nr:hypothetical protein F4780DRAFT_733417 [Xylariomycetidae sp. FL0641]